MLVIRSCLILWYLPTMRRWFSSHSYSMQCVVDHSLYLCFFLLDIVLSVLLRCTDSLSYSHGELRILFLNTTVSIAYLGACTSYQANYLILLQPMVFLKVSDTKKYFLKSAVYWLYKHEISTFKPPTFWNPSYMFSHVILLLNPL